MKDVSTSRRAAVLAITMLLSLSALARAGENAPSPRIIVSGQGAVAVAPDMAQLALTVTTEATTAREALTNNSATMTKVLKAMGAMGIAERDLQTANFSIQPRRTHPSRQGSEPAEEPRIIGYTVRNGLNVRVRDLKKLGEVLDASVTLGVNEGGGIRFTNDDPSDAIAKARVKAVEDALAKAKTLADAAGVKLGGVLEISEQSGTPRPMSMARAEMAMDYAPNAVPIAAGENTYKVAVNVTVAIAP
jgi:uncharacterized protein YggE